jgi:DNA-binding response OmpR family regulator
LLTGTLAETLMTRILVVDDDKSVGTAIKTVLEAAGFDVVHSIDCMSGVAQIKAAEFDVVMVDLFMPGIDGLETIKAFRQIKPQVPIIAISGFLPRDGHGKAPDFLGMATKLGANRSLAKPFRPRDLMQAVEACLSGTADAPAPASAP